MCSVTVCDSHQLPLSVTLYPAVHMHNVAVAGSDTWLLSDKLRTLYMPGHISGTLTFPVTCSVHRTFPSSNLLSFCLCYQPPSLFLSVWCKAVSGSAGSFSRTQGKRQLMCNGWLLCCVWWSSNRHVWNAVRFCCTWPCTIVQHDVWWQIASMTYRMALQSDCGFSGRNIELSASQEQKYRCCVGLHGFSQGQFLAVEMCAVAWGPPQRLVVFQISIFFSYI